MYFQIGNAKSFLFDIVFICQIVYCYICLQVMSSFSLLYGYFFGCPMSNKIIFQGL